MAFNVLGTFQKNKRFWMAAVLMICMVSFVFCTGMKGGMEERILDIFGLKSRGPAIVTIDGRGISSKDLHDLRAQRNLADAIMRICADIASKKVSKELFELGKKADPNQDPEKLKQIKMQLGAVRATLDLRKSRPRYFDIGVAKFDDLVEFKLWQAEADRLGIHLDDRHVRILFGNEFFNTERVQWVSREELAMAQREAMHRNFREANDTFVRHAVAEEFRVRIARLAVQTSSVRRGGRPGEGMPLKFDDPDLPDPLRAPLTLAQLWDFYKLNRAEFDVKLIPVNVQDLLAELKDAKGKLLEPNDLQKREVFEKNKYKPNDPSSEDPGLEKPAQVKVEFVYADPLSPEYLGKAKFVAQMKSTNPIAFDMMQSPLVTATRFMAVAQNEQDQLERHYDRQIGRNNRYFGAAFFGETDCNSQVLARIASRNPLALASVIFASALAPANPLEAQNAVAGHLAWGAVTKLKMTPVDPQDLQNAAAEQQVSSFLANPGEVEMAIQSEVRRRVPVYLKLFPGGTTRFPLTMAAPYLTMDFPINSEKPAGYYYLRPRYTPETVQGEIKDMLNKQTARVRAQETMAIVRKELEKSANDSEKFKRALNKLVPEHKLTYGPPPDKKGNFYNRFNIGAAKEFEVLKDSFAEYTNRINMYEGRDVTPARVLKASDGWKMFFDGTEEFAAKSLHRAMPWPPEVKPDAARAWKLADPLLMNRLNLKEADEQLLERHLAQHDPNKPAPALDLFQSADLPILFWRSAELPPIRPADYDRIVKDLDKVAADLAKVATELKEIKDTNKAVGLKKKEADLKQTQADLQEVMARVSEGWKFDETRRTKALPRAQSVAMNLINKGRNFQDIEAEASKLNQKVLLLPNLSQMYPDRVVDAPDARRILYTLPPLPKDMIPHSRDDMMKELLSLFDMKAPISIGNKDLDDVNKELFDLVSKDQDKNKPANFIQILTNKPRSIYYVALISQAPKASQEDFHQAMLRASEMKFGPLRDFFAQRAQEDEAKQYRADLIHWLQQSHKYSLDNDSARKEFDERGVGE
ncbi:MAG: hypothetical protein EXR98_03040 [Gemmataceae bacterium]|nr:hypothetical protein [Gemmataceae bacterium]